MRKFKIAGFSLALAVTIIAFQNMIPVPTTGAITYAQLDQTDATGVCKVRPGAAGAPFYDAMKAGGLVPAEIIAHAANRLGYGIAPYGPIVPARANDCRVVFMAEELARQLASLGATPDSSAYLNTRNALLPLANYTRYEINQAGSRFEKEEPTSFARGRLARWARFAASWDLTLRELVGSQVITATGVVDHQMNLESLLTQFWFNHFNVESKKAESYYFGNDSYPATLRKHLNGTFHSLAMAAFSHPAMIVYLDNVNNRYDTVAGAASNQNLGREILELYTMGVPPGAGAYTQGDVEAMAKILAGWTTYPYWNQIDVAHSGSYFASTLAANIDVTLMGKVYPQPASDRVSIVVADLALKTETKNNICGKLGKQFYASSLRAAATLRCVADWGATGNLATVYRGLFLSKDFWSRANYRTMFRSPIEQIIATGRQTGFNVQDFESATRAMAVQPSRFVPSQMTASGFQADLDLYWQEPMSKPLNQINELIGVMLGKKRGEVPPPTGHSYLGEDFLSSYYLDNLSRLSLEIAALFPALDKSARQDPVYWTVNDQVRTNITTLGPAGAIDDYSTKRLCLGRLSSAPAPALPILPSHYKLLLSVTASESKQPYWSQSNYHAAHLGMVSTALGTAEFMMK